MSEPMRQPADMLARLGRHWGWVLAFGMEIGMAFRVRSVSHAATGFLVHIRPGR